MSNMTFAEAACQTLKQAGKPLTADEITSMALERGIVSTTGKTPSATMGARLYVDIKTRGDKSRFVKVNRGKFYLIEVKARNEIRDEDVQTKARAAEAWCYAMSKATGKPWEYKLIPHDAILLTKSFRGIISNAVTLSDQLPLN